MHFSGRQKKHNSSMHPVFEQILPEYMHYWIVVGFGKFFRVFWFFFVFELVRYILLEYGVMFYYACTRKSRMRRREQARALLRAENPLVSIIVPGKNEGKNIYKLVRSLKEQTYQNFELIIVDDGSDDDTPVIGKNLLGRGFLTQFLRNNQRGGKASAANLALRRAKGNFIVHLDADCSFDRDAIEQILVPFYMDARIGAVGGNVKVRNHRDTLCARLQAIEYLRTISVGRIVTSELGIYKIISGAFGAFRKSTIDAVGGWDIGPGLDGDITVKIRKSGYKTVFEPAAICLTSVPASFKKLTRQRLRWDKSVIRFRVRKHADIFVPNANFNAFNFFASFENIFYNVVLNITWWVYCLDMVFNYSHAIQWIIPMNMTLYTCAGFLQMWAISRFSERREEERYLWWYVPMMKIYTGWYLRLVRTRAYFEEIFLKKSYDDVWNPRKSSLQAKINGF